MVTKMRFIYAFALLLFTVSLQAQGKEYISFLNSVKFDPNRYEDIKGSPYYFEDWKTGKVISYMDTMKTDLLFNFNGYTKYIEVRKNDQVIVLDNRIYQEVFMDNEEEPEYPYHFSTNGPREISESFHLVIHKGKNFAVYQTYISEVAESTIQDVGKTVQLKSFGDKEIYYLYQSNKLSILKLKKKWLVKQFGKEVEKIMKENKTDLGNYADLVLLFRKLDQ